jgi:RNA polymerase sigma factor (sigma-70 family)
MDDEALSPVANVKNDVSLAARAQGGDESAWTAIVELHWKQVWNLCRIVVREQHGAEELAQETFRVVREQLGAYDGDRTLCSWIQSVCRRRALDEIRRRRHTREANPGAGDERPAHPELELALTAMEPEEREALLLAAAGSAHDELAAMLGLTAAGMRSRTARARMRLLDQLDAGGPA